MTAEAEAYSTAVIAEAIKENGLEAAQYQVALKQVEALNALATGRASRRSSSLRRDRSVRRCLQDAARTRLNGRALVGLGVGRLPLGIVEVFIPGFFFLGFSVGAVLTGSCWSSAFAAAWASLR